MIDKKTGIHEPTVIIPWWLVINGPTVVDLIEAKLDERLSQDEIRAAAYQRERINEILGGR